MIWGPFVLALALGLVVSAGLYFAYLWPQVEPDDADVGAGTETAGTETAEAIAETDAATEAATEAPAPTSETSPA